MTDQKIERYMTAFEISENNGRPKALAILNSIILDDNDNYTIVPTTGFCKWDFEVRDNDTHKCLAIIEVKDRQFASTDKRVAYGVQLEEGKYNALIARGEMWHIPAYYLATFTDGKGMMWDVRTAPHTEDDRMCNLTTAEDNGKVMKHCYYFKAEDSVLE